MKPKAKAKGFASRAEMRRAIHLREARQSRVLLEARRRDGGDWGTLQTFAGQPQSELTEAAQRALGHWITTWHAASEHEFRIRSV